MSQQNIDENVVKMSFDNAEFEKGVKTSMSTLDKLKNSLNMSSSVKSLKELDRAANSVSFSSLTSGLESVKVKFSALEVAGMTVISNLTTSAMNALSNVYNTTLGQIKSGGWKRALNIEHANFMLQGLTNGLKNADEIVAQVMEDANYAVTDTAYGLDVAANAAAQFYASGVKEGDEMKQALLGISGVAAMTSSEFSDIANIFTTVAGNGRLMSDQLLQFSARGLNAAATLASYLGTTESAVRELVSDGKIDFQTFAMAMSESFGTQAKKANDTFTGALSNMKAALSRIGALFAQPALTQFRDMLNSLTPVINTVKNALAPFVTVYEKTLTAISKKTQSALSAFQELLNYKNSINLSKWNELKGVYGEDTMSALRKALMKNVKENDESTYKLIKEAGSFKDSLAEGWLSPDLINSALSDALDDTAESVEKTTVSMKKLNKVATEVIRGNYGNGYARVKALTKAGYDYASVQSIVNNRILGTKVNIKNLSDEQLKSVGYSEEQIKALRTLSEEAENANTPLNELMNSLEYKSTSELVIESLVNSFKALKRVLTAVKGGFDAVFPAKTSNQIHSIVEQITKFTKSLIPTKKQTKKLTSVFKGLFSILDLIAYYVTGALKIGFNTLCNIFGIFADDALDTSSNLGDLIYNFRNWAKENDKILPTLESLATALTNGLQAIKDWVDQFKETEAVQGAIDTLKSKASGMFSIVSTKALDGISTLKEFVASLDLSDKLSPENVISGLTSIKDTALNVKDSFVEFVQSLMEMDSISLDNIRECLSDLWESLKNIFGFGFGFSGGDTDTINDSITTVEEFSTSLAGLNATADESSNKIVNFFENLKNALSKIDWGSVAAVTSLIGIIAGIGKVSKAISEVFTLGKLGNAATALLGQIKSAVAEYQKEIDSKKVLNIAKAIESLAIALGIIALIPSDKIGTCCEVLAGMAGAIVLVSWALAKINSIGELDVGTKLITALTAFKALSSIAGAILALSISLKIISTMDVEDITSKIIGIIEIVGTALGMLLGGGLIKRFLGGFGLAEIIGITAMILLMGKALNTLNNLPTDFDTIKHNITAMIEVFALFFGLCTAAGKLGDIPVGTGLALIGIATSLIAMTAAIAILGNMDVTVLGKGGLAVSALMVVIGVMMNLGKEYKGSATATIALLAGVSVCLIAMTAVIAILGHMDINVLLQGGAALAAGMLMIGFVLSQASEISSGFNKSSLIGLGVAITLIAASIAALTLIDSTKLAIASACVAGVMGMFALILKASSTMTQAKATLVIMAGVIVILAGCIYILGNNLETGKAIEAAASISVLMLALSACLKIIGSMATIATSGLISLAIIGGLAVVLAALLAYISGTIKDGDKYLKVVTSISVLMTSLSASLLLISIAGGIAEIAYPGIIILGVALVALTAFIGILGSISGAKEAITSGLDILNVMFSGLGEALGQFGVSLSETFITVGDNLSKFMDSVQPFIDGITNIPENFLTNIVNLCAAIGKLGAAELYSSWENVINIPGLLSEVFTGQSSEEQLINRLINFVEPLGTLSEKISGIENLAQLNSFSIIVENLCSAIGNLKGVGNKVIDNFNNFGTALGGFGPKLATFWISIAEINPSQISAAATSLSTLIDTLKGCKDVDTESISNFGTSLNNLAGSGLKDVVSDLTQGQTFQQYSAALSDAGSNLTTTLSSGLTSDTSLSNVSDSAESVISTLTDKIQSSISDGSMSEIGTDAITEMFGDIDSSEVLSQIQDSVNVDTDSIQDTLSSYMASDTSGEDLMTNVASGMTSESSISSLTNATTTDLTTVTDTIKSYKTNITTAAESLMNSFALGLRSASVISRIKESAKYDLQALQMTLSSGAKKIYEAGGLLGSSADQGTRDATEVSSPSKKFKEIGAFCVEGFALGLQEYNAKQLVGASTMAETLDKMSDMVDGSMDITPTISPVVDLTSVRSASDSINGLLGSSSARLAFSTSGISSGVSSIQNGRNSDVISALNRLAQKFDKASGDNYTINGITYDDGSNVASAVQSLVRAARVERRM